MTSITIRRALALVAVTALAVLAPSRVFAGPPLICHPYDIAKATSLPGGSDRFGTSATYDRTHLVADTLALLKPEMPVLVRMETLRRAAIYATGNLRTWDGQKYTSIDKELGAALIAKLQERTNTKDNAARALAVFDLGFFSESLRQTGLDPALDGYALLVKSAETLKDNPDVEFALALASWSPKRAEHADHLARARTLAQPGSLLAANLVSHFGKS
jgi:hypothetical protein